MTSAAPALVCVPGTMCAPLIFDPLRRPGIDVETVAWNELAPPHDVGSVARLVADAVATHSSAVLIGHSTGGVMALSAVLGGARPRGLVLCDTGANMRDHGDVESIIRRVRQEWGPGFWRAHVERSVTRGVPPGIRRALEEYPSGVDPELIEQVLRSQQSIDLLPRLGEVHVPTLVVHGRRDAARPLAHAEALVAGIPDARLVVLDCGHTPTIELPERAAEVVGAFVASLA